MTDLTLVQKNKCFGGQQAVYEHFSEELDCKTKFAVFMPSIRDEKEKFPVVYYLSGLTCTEQNMVIKSGFQRYAEENRLIVVGPDTSPRGCKIPTEDEYWDFGTGAGFYVDATQEPWSQHYRMYSYVTQELRKLIEEIIEVADTSRVGISGHSMGGHGALVAFFRNPDIYKAVSAFAPIANPINSPWGIKCFGLYLGEDQEAWKEYDATELVKKHPRKDVKILIDQGGNDEWMSHLTPQNFVEACEEVGQPLQYNERPGYDHSYFFISTFIGEHLKFFGEELRK